MAQHRTPCRDILDPREPGGATTLPRRLSWRQATFPECGRTALASHRPLTGETADPSSPRLCHQSPDRSHLKDCYWATIPTMVGGKVLWSSTPVKLNVPLPPAAKSRVSVTVKLLLPLLNSEPLPTPPVKIV
jgi:hypothetical protein